MNCIYQTLNDRIDIIKEVNSAIKLLQQQANNRNGNMFRQNIMQMKKHELLLQEMEQKCLQKIQKYEFSHNDLKRFNLVMYNLVKQMFPQLANMHKIQLDGKATNIRNLFFLLFRKLNLSEKINEMQQLDLKSLMPMLTQSIVRIQRKMLDDKFRQFNLILSNSQKSDNNQKNKKTIRIPKLTPNKFNLSQHIQFNSPERMEQRQNAFKQITNVLNNTVIEDVPSTLYCATVKYQDLLARNKGVKFSMDNIQSQTLSPNFEFSYYNKGKEIQKIQKQLKLKTTSIISKLKQKSASTLINSFRIQKIK